MCEPFIGSEAIAAGTITKVQLATRYRRLFPDVYVERAVDVTAESGVKAGWLWAGRRGVVAGFSAAALHGSKWVENARAVELVHDNRRRPPGIRTHRDRIDVDEIELLAGLPVISSVRTALDLGCWYPTTTAVVAIDALAHAIEIKAADVELLSLRYVGRRGVTRARLAISLFDAGAQSPKESWLRTIIVQAGLPRPQTQIPVSGSTDGTAGDGKCLSDSAGSLSGSSQEIDPPRYFPVFVRRWPTECAAGRTLGVKGRG